MIVENFKKRIEERFEERIVLLTLSHNTNLVWKLYSKLTIEIIKEWFPKQGHEMWSESEISKNCICTFIFCMVHINFLGLFSFTFVYENSIYYFNAKTLVKSKMNLTSFSVGVTECH